MSFLTLPPNLLTTTNSTAVPQTIMNYPSAYTPATATHSHKPHACVTMICSRSLLTRPPSSTGGSPKFGQRQRHGSPIESAVAVPASAVAVVPVGSNGGAVVAAPAEARPYRTDSDKLSDNEGASYQKDLGMESIDCISKAVQVPKKCERTSSAKNPGPMPAAVTAQSRDGSSLPTLLPLQSKPLPVLRQLERGPRFDSGGGRGAVAESESVMMSFPKLVMPSPTPSNAQTIGQRYADAPLETPAMVRTREDAPYRYTSTGLVTSTAVGRPRKSDLEAAESTGESTPAKPPNVSEISWRNFIREELLRDARVRLFGDSPTARTPRARRGDQISIV